MPLVPFILALLVVLFLVLSTPVLLLLRYRTGTMRRRARIGPAAVNLVLLLLSAALFIWFAALANFWVRSAFPYSLSGLSLGCLLGLIGLFLTRWEKQQPALYYTPNRWLVLLITFAVAARLLYGLWRVWHALRTTGAGESWLASAGVAGSMAVGAMVLGYYLTYIAGLCWQLRRAT